MALNFQTPTDPMFVNAGMFRQNAGCGYVLKPQWQRSVAAAVNPQQLQNMNPAVPTTLPGGSYVAGIVC